MSVHHPLRTTMLVGAVAPKIPPWAGPVRIAAPGSLTTSARSLAPLGIKWPDALGD